MAVARVEADPTTIAVVSVTPMSSAVAVAAVRRGLRVALPAASRAGTPPTRPANRPAAATTGGTARWASSTIPRKLSTPPGSAIRTFAIATPIASSPMPGSNRTRPRTRRSTPGPRAQPGRVDRTHRGERGDAGRAPGRGERGQEGHRRPDEEPDSHRVERHRHPGERDRRVGAADDGGHPGGQADPGEHADRRGGEAGHQRLAEHAAPDLPGGRADAAQQGQLAGPLRQQDGEGVGDDQARDQHGDGGEHQQDGGQRRRVAQQPGRDVLRPARCRCARRRPGRSGPWRRRVGPARRTPRVRRRGGARSGRPPPTPAPAPW